MAKTKRKIKSRRRDTSIKLGKYETKWFGVYGIIGGLHTKLFTTKTLVKDMLPGLTIMGLGEVRYTLETEKKDDKAKDNNN